MNSLTRFSISPAVVLAWVGLGVVGCSETRHQGHPTDADASAPVSLAVAHPSRARSFTRDEHGAYVAFHLQQRLTAKVDGGGARFAPLDGGWRLALGARRIGRAAAMHTLESGVPHEKEGRVEITRPGVTEWFAGEAGGIEHGLDLFTRPDGAGPLVVEVVPAGLTAASTGDSVTLADAAGRVVLHYDTLTVRDADGYPVPARMHVGATGAIELRIDDATARYPLAIDPLVWAQQAKLVAADGAPNDWFGSAVALNGATAVIGASEKTVGSNALQGAAYVFVQSGGVWTQQAKLVAADGAASDRFGSSVALSGTVALVGAYNKTVGANANQGAAYVFVQSGGTWTQQAKLVASDGAAGDILGASVALSGNTALLGAYKKTIGTNGNQGAAYVFAGSGGAWAQQATLLASDGAAQDKFGVSVAVSGTTALIGAYSKTVGANALQGAAYVFTASGSSWTQQAKLVAADGATNDYFGNSVAVAGTTAVVGAYNKTLGAVGQGAAYVFAQSGSTWSQQAKLSAGDGAANDYFGVRVAVSGSIALVGAFGKAIGTNPQQGAAYAFAPSAGAWAQQSKVVAADGAANDQLGSTVALDGTTALVGAYTKSAGQGAAYVFTQKLGNGEPCTAPAACGSGHCVDGLCCDTKCDAQCEACDVSGGAGTCQAVTGKPHGARTRCVGSGVCAGACDGKARDVCAFPGFATDCVTASCVDGVETQATSCDGKGACKAAITRPCTPFKCGVTTCKTTCKADTDCAGGACDLATGLCATVSTKCDGGHVLKTPGQPDKDCTPLKCAGTTCLPSCSTSTDCVTGFLCDTGSGRCVGAAGSNDNGGGCAHGTRGAGGGWLVVVLSLSLGGRRLRRLAG